MKVKTIKDVDDETWKILKELSSRRKMKMGRVLRYAVRNYARKPEKNLTSIIPKEPILTNKEAEDILKYVKKMRKESGYRDVSGF
jgi:hypothetical protein